MSRENLLDSLKDFILSERRFRHLGIDVLELVIDDQELHHPCREIIWCRPPFESITLADGEFNGLVMQRFYPRFGSYEEGLTLARAEVQKKFERMVFLSEPEFTKVKAQT